ncbi:MAG: hypothetical protein NTW19_10840 [Planctomycetota bacterium]|nr:hypothetical protein [Planctomycetota bacterium]
MNSRKLGSKDPDILASVGAMKRAARAARKLSRETGTPFYVMKSGHIVDLNASAKKKRPKTA